jgi:hypothetical protein
MSKYSVAFQPIVSIDQDGTIDTDWFQSFTGVYDAGGNYDPDDEGAEAAGELLDSRIAQIRDLLAVDNGTLAELVRPFFQVVER